MENRSLAEANYASFITKALAGGKVYGLQDRDGAWAVCPSLRNPDTDVIVFWSDRSSAKFHVKEEWTSHRVGEIGLDLFVGVWLRGMHEDGYFVGPDWDDNLEGLEIEAIEVAKRLTEENDQQAVE